MRILIAMLLVSACGSKSGGGGDDVAGDAAAISDSSDSGMPITLPDVNAKVDYQLGGAYPPPSGVTIVSRDRKATPATGLYNICYINGFQIQPDEENYWLNLHPDLILRDANGTIVKDTQWNEMLLDIRIAEKRTAIASIVGGWIRECRQNSFNAIEIDNLDSYTRSQGLLLESQAVLTMKMLSDAAHASAMPIAQKNSSELVARKAELGTDFAVAEECNRYNECGTYTGGYGDHVIVIEYRQQDFNAGCLAFPNLSIVLRDLNLVTPTGTGYVYDGC
ncbi:MAG TPA: endo alpha-1,4 polygalactosaminidase [Kofleriaceae bacterium]